MTVFADVKQNLENIHDHPAFSLAVIFGQDQHQSITISLESAIPFITDSLITTILSNVFIFCSKTTNAQKKVSS